MTDPVARAKPPATVTPPDLVHRARSIVERWGAELARAEPGAQVAVSAQDLRTVVEAYQSTFAGLARVARALDHGTDPFPDIDSLVEEIKDLLADRGELTRVLVETTLLSRDAGRKRNT